jgi:hypothetical protein
MSGVLVIRTADDCIVCIERKASGQFDYIQKQVEAAGYKVIPQEVAYHEIGDPKGPDLFNFPRFTPYFMFMMESTYNQVMRDNPPPESVLHSIRLYNWMVTADLRLVKSETYQRFFDDMVKFCKDSQASLSGIALSSVSRVAPRQIRTTPNPINFRS